jgi:membrane-associated phospholipid phosphatase
MDSRLAPRAGPPIGACLVMALTLFGGPLHAQSLGPATGAAADPSSLRARRVEPASTPDPAPKAGSREGRPDDGRRTIARLPVNLGRGVIGLWSPHSLAPILAGGAATGIAFAFDDDVRDAVGNPGSSFGATLESIGGFTVIGSAVGGLFVAGRIAHPPRFRAMTYDMLEATLITVGVTELLKPVVGRERPDGSDNKSFPSGHASLDFAVATVAQLHYGWKVGAPCYAVAGLVAYSRLVQDVHYLSDVTAGATIGVVVAFAVLHTNRRPLADGAASGWTVAPILAKDTYGLQVTLRR